MTRAEIIEVMARRMYDDEYRAMSELVAAMDKVAGKRCHVHSLGKWESVNKLYEERAKSAASVLTAAGLAIVPMEPSDAMLKTVPCGLLASKRDLTDMAEAYRAMIAAAIKEQEGRD